MLTGTIKTYNQDQGFGYITPDNGTEDAYVHQNAFANLDLNTITIGQKVSFDLIIETGKKIATNVQLIKAA